MHGTDDLDDALAVAATSSPLPVDVTRAALELARAAGGERYTLVELPELLLNARFRTFVVNQPTVPEVVRPFWMAYEAMSDAERT